MKPLHRPHSIYAISKVNARQDRVKKSQSPTGPRPHIQSQFLLALILFSVLAASIGGENAFAKPQAPDPRHGSIKSQHGDWQIVCKPPPPGAKNPVCAVVQSVTAEDRNNVGLTVYFQRFSDGTQVLRVFAPLGVLLPPGLGLKVDGKDLGNAPFLRCQTFACYAQVTVDEKLIKILRTGKTAIFVIFQTEEEGIGIPISLNGFAEAQDNLK